LALSPNRQFIEGDQNHCCLKTYVKTNQILVSMACLLTYFTRQNTRTMKKKFLHSKFQLIKNFTKTFLLLAMGPGVEWTADEKASAALLDNVVMWPGKLFQLANKLESWLGMVNTLFSLAINQPSIYWRLGLKGLKLYNAPLWRGMDWPWF